MSNAEEMQWDSVLLGYSVSISHRGRMKKHDVFKQNLSANITAPLIVHSWITMWMASRLADECYSNGLLDSLISVCAVYFLWGGSSERQGSCLKAGNTTELH